MAVKLQQVGVVSEGDEDAIAIDFTPWLDPGELLTGTPTVTEVDTEDLTITNVAVSESALSILGSTAVAGAAVQAFVSGWKSGTRYVLRVTAETDATPARKAVRDFVVRCV